MARSFSQYLLAAAVAAVVGGPALAQEKTPLQEAVTLLRLSKGDEALAKLREIIASDPSNTDAFAMYKSVSQDEWYMLLSQKGEDGGPSDIQKIAQTLLERARIESKALSRDEATISGLVATAIAKDSDYSARSAAVNKLIADHGEFAVPPLVAKLGDNNDEEGQVQAIFVLQELRSAAVLPLIEALKSTNPLVVRNAAAALHHIGDDRAIPAMAQLATDSRPEVAAVASKFLDKKKASGNGIDLTLAQGAAYLRGDVPVGAFSDVVWNLKDEKLVPTDVPALLYPAELAKKCGNTALSYGPDSLAARSLVAQANVAQARLIEQSIAQGDEASKALEPVAAELKNAALATGVDALRAALEAGIQSGLAPVAIGAIDALAAAESIETVEQSTLLAALNNSNKQIRYAAAAALVKAGGGVKVPQSGAVVGVLAEAVTEEAVRTIQVIAPSVETKAAVEAASGSRGLAVDASGDAITGMQRLMINPNVDVVVINELLPDRMPEDIIGNMKKDPRMANAKVVIIAKDEEKAKERFGEGALVVKAPLTGENLVAAVNASLEGVTTPANARAEGIAVRASESLAAMAANKQSIDAAVQNLSKQLTRSDAVAVPAARALGFAGTAAELPALTAALGGGGSIDLKKASAQSIGSILARLSDCPADVYTAMIAALDGGTDVELRAKVSNALAKAKLSAEQRTDLMKKLNRVAAPVAEAAPASEG